jgi:hypothetical protein
LVFDLILGQFVGLEGKHVHNGTFMAILPFDSLDAFDDLDGIDSSIRDHEDVASPRDRH